MTDIETRIMTHKEIYENASLEVPPFRITYAECMQLSNDLVKRHHLDERLKYQIICEYYSVQLEVVVPLK